MVNRLLKLNRRNSILLFGPRGTGKTTLIREHLKNSKEVLWVDLLKPELEEEYLKDPGLLRERILAKNPRVVVIDEVQKVPALLSVAHEIIEKIGTRFVLTGSSARKLKRQGADLLAGRAFSYHLDALSSYELDKRFNLTEALEYGFLPKIYFPNPSKPGFKWFSEEKIKYLQTYARTYLNEEILLEQQVRKVQPFRTFLEVAAQMNGKVIEYSNIAKDVGVDPKTVMEYFMILEDTLIGFMLQPYHKSLRKRQGKKPKFYLFDTGVKRALERTLSVKLLHQTGAYGEAFEHFIILELRKIAQTIDPDIKFSFFRTRDGTQEVDLILEIPGEKPVLIEIKSSRKVSDKEIGKLLVFRHDFPGSKFYILCQESSSRLVNGIKIMPWQEGISEILGFRKVNDKH